MLTLNGVTAGPCETEAVSIVLMKRAVSRNGRVADQPHVPMLQVSPGAQALKHAPQCSGSVGNMAQWVPHLLMFGLGKHWQTPALQVPAPVHGVSQAPQCSLSRVRSAHFVLQSERLPAHSHTPDWQLEPGGHTLPQLPQLS